MYDFEWFKNEITPKLKGLELQYRYFKEGDFGDLNEIEFSFNDILGVIDFWGLNWVEILVINSETGEKIISVFLEPNQEKEKEEAFESLQLFLAKHGFLFT